MSNTYRNFHLTVRQLHDEDDWNDGKSVRKHFVKQKRLRVRQHLRNLNVDEFDNDWMEDF